MPKYGASRGKQTYRYGDCYYRYTPQGNRHYYSERVKDQALSMYLEGNSLSAIGWVLGVKLETVYSRVQKSLSCQGDLGPAPAPSGLDLIHQPVLRIPI